MPGFRIKRHNEPIESYPVTNTVNTGITASIYFELWEAFIAAGATVDELAAMDAGHYDRRFLAKVIAWHRGNIEVKKHGEDAVQKASEKGGRRGRR